MAQSKVASLSLAAAISLSGASFNSAEGQTYNNLEWRAADDSGWRSVSPVRSEAAPVQPSERYSTSLPGYSNSNFGNLNNASGPANWREDQLVPLAQNTYGSPYYPTDPGQATVQEQSPVSFPELRKAVATIFRAVNDFVYDCNPWGLLVGGAAAALLVRRGIVSAARGVVRDVQRDGMLGDEMMTLQQRSSSSR